MTISFCSCERLWMAANGTDTMTAPRVPLARIHDHGDCKSRMTQDPGSALSARIDLTALALTAVTLMLVLILHLLPALFAGLLVHELVHLLAPRVFGLKDQPGRAKIVVVALLSALVVTIFTVALAGAIAFFKSESGSVAMLLQKMAEILDSSRASLPVWAQDWLPGDGADLREQSVSWLRAHATEIRTMGGVAGRAIAYALVGMVVGALIALYEMQPEHRRGPLAR